MMEPRERSIFVLLTNTGTLFTRAIGLFSRAPYNHSSIALDDELTDMYSFGRKKPRNPFIGGFVHEDRRRGLYALKEETTCAVYELRVSDEEYAALQASIKGFCQEQDRYRYSLIGLIGVAFHRPVNRRYAFFCSQFVATVLEQSGALSFGKPPGLVRPEDFRNHPRLKLVYESKLREYHGQSAQ